MSRFDAMGNTLNAHGQLYVQLATTAGTAVKAGPGRLARIIPIVGTGAVTIYDNASAASGTILYTIAAVAVGTPIEIDIPATAGMFAVVGASTTVNIVYT
jgi:hypothetical protein